MISAAHADAISYAVIRELEPTFAAKVKAWYEGCLAKGIRVYIYDGRRSCERQAELYAIGRSDSRKKVTWAKPGQSYHQYGLAVDWVPLVPHAKVEGMMDPDWNNEDLYRLGRIEAENHGLEGITEEEPHLQDARFTNWRDVFSAFRDQLPLPWRQTIG